MFTKQSWELDYEIAMFFDGLLKIIEGIIDSGQEFRRLRGSVQ